MLEAEQPSGSWCGWKDNLYLIIFNYTMGSWSLDLPACSIAPQITYTKINTVNKHNTNKNLYYALNSNNNEIRIVRNCCTCTSPWPSIHSTSLSLHRIHFHDTIYPSLTNFISLHLTSDNIIAIHLTSLPYILMICITQPFNMLSHFPNLFIKLLGLQESVPKASAVNLFSYCSYCLLMNNLVTPSLMLSWKKTALLLSGLIIVSLSKAHCPLLFKSICKFSTLLLLRIFVYIIYLSAKSLIVTQYISRYHSHRRGTIVKQKQFLTVLLTLL
jgi:hypothetical protein